MGASCCAPLVTPRGQRVAASERHGFRKAPGSGSGGKSSLVPRETPRWRKLYRGRAAGEREFGRLKYEWALLPLRVRGIERVRLHAA